MKVLFVGGTGVISAACAARAREAGIALTLLTRGHSFRPPPPGADVVVADARDDRAVDAALRGRSFDVVVDWVAFEPAHIEQALHRFDGRVGQYVFISSASVYRKPAALPVVESAPLGNPYWDYARLKIACEERLAEAVAGGFPATIVRPSHTYDRTLVPLRSGHTMLDRLRRGLPIVLHDDGAAPWTLTHHTDFAAGFVDLLGHPGALGRTLHLTADEALSWNEIAAALADAAGVAARVVHVPATVLAGYDPRWGASLLGDKAWPMIFDNTAVRRLVPDYRPAVSFHQGAREIVAWFDAHPERRAIDPAFDALLDRIVARHGPARELPGLRDA